MILNEISDTNKPILNKKDNIIFYYIFSSDAHIIAESPMDYDYATPDQSILIKMNGEKLENGRTIYRLQNQ